MDGIDNKKTEQEIARDFVLELNKSNVTDSAPVEASGVLSLKPKCKLSIGAARFLVNIKNSAEISFLSKDLNEMGIQIVNDCLKTTDEEVNLWKDALEQIFDEYGTPELIDWVNKWAGSPIVILIENEVHKIRMLKKMLNESHLKSPPVTQKEAA